jgi:predicted nuclease of predicted toxin-antitoxin system
LKILVDENLTPDLAQLGNARGYYTASVPHLGLAGRKDSALIPYCIEHDYVLMSIDDGDPKALADAAGVHPGLVFIDGANYQAMFSEAAAAIDYIEERAAAAGEDPASFMINTVVERDESGEWKHYDLPDGEAGSS